MRKTAQTGRAGFSLVEVSLALLVVGVGMMGAFALFPVGLDAGKLALEDSRASLFSDEAFDSIRTLSVAGTNLTGVTDYRDAVSAGPGSDFWSASGTGPSLLAPRVTDKTWSGTELWTNIYSGSVTNSRYAGTWQFALTTPIPDYAFRYRLECAPHSNTNLFRIRQARLSVWPGEFGATTNSDFVFYTELYDFGM
jgi:prepilin-type N-terminal cleavage/methylation domain-containing protein